MSMFEYWIDFLKPSFPGYFYDQSGGYINCKRFKRDFRRLRVYVPFDNRGNLSHVCTCPLRNRAIRKDQGLPEALSTQLWRHSTCTRRGKKRDLCESEAMCVGDFQQNSCDLSGLQARFTDEQDRGWNPKQAQSALSVIVCRGEVRSHRAVTTCCASAFSLSCLNRFLGHILCDSGNCRTICRGFNWPSM